MVRIPKHLSKVSEAELETVAELRVALRRFIAATDEVTKEHGLTSRQYDLLALLHRPHDTPPTASGLAEQLSLSRSAVTELVTRAAEAGLVSREPDRGDNRVKYLAPTHEGSRRFLAAVNDLRNERLRLFTLLRAAAVLASTLTASI